MSDNPTTGRPRGRRLGVAGRETISTRQDPTPPEHPSRRPADSEQAGQPEQPGQDLVPTDDRPPAPAGPMTPGAVGGHPYGTIPAADRPRATDLITPSTPMAREQINGAVPAALQLQYRMGLYQLQRRVDRQDQLALALDEWLSRQGY